MNLEEEKKANLLPNIFLHVYDAADGCPLFCFLAVCEYKMHSRTPFVVFSVKLCALNIYLSSVYFHVPPFLSLSVSLPVCLPCPPLACVCDKILDLDAFPHIVMFACVSTRVSMSLSSFKADPKQTHTQPIKHQTQSSQTSINNHTTNQASCMFLLVVLLRRIVFVFATIVVVFPRSLFSCYVFCLSQCVCLCFVCFFFCNIQQLHLLFVLMFDGHLLPVGWIV